MTDLTHIIRITRDGALAWTGYAERLPQRFGSWRTILKLLLYDHEFTVYDADSGYDYYLDTKES